MAQYGVVYRMEFDDVLGAAWRIDFLQRGVISSPLPILLKGSAEPLVLDKKNDDESIFSPFITTTAKITYKIDSSLAPVPRTFILIDEKEWMVNIYKGAVLDFRGFIRPDNNNYPWRPLPYDYTVNAVDFTFAKGTPINLNEDGLFLYDFITIGDFINRTLFAALGYDDPILDILYTPLPDVVSSAGDILTDGIYVHTDAFYEVDTGPEKIYNAISRLLKSLGARIFFADGRYQIQRFQDIGSSPQQLIRVTPDNILGNVYTNPDTQVVLSLNNVNGIFYYNNSATAKVNLTLKQRTYNYDLKGINQIKNFDWRFGDGLSPFPNWEGDVSHDGILQRVGTGTTEDQFRLQINQWDFPTGKQIWSRIPVVTDQLIELELKAIGSNVKFLEIEVYLVPTGTINIGDGWRLDEGGQWVEANGNSSDAMRISVEDPNIPGTFNLLSKRIPLMPGGASSMDLLFQISRPIPIDSPTGPVYVQLYPVFGRIYYNPYVRYVETISNNADYSFIDDDDDRFFLDKGNDRLSNTLFYNNGSAIVPLPVNNWDGKTIDEQTIRTELDLQHRPGFGVEGDFMGNKLSFHHAVVLADEDNIITMQIRDSYSVKSATHSLALIEIMEAGSGDGTYTVIPKTNR